MTNTKNPNANQATSQSANKPVKSDNVMNYYIPHRVWAVLFILFALIIAMRDELYIRFMATPELNTVILTTTLIVLIMNITNILKFQASSNFINTIVTATKKQEFNKYDGFLAKLKKNNYIYDSFAMRQSLEKSSQKKKLIFTDKDAILIKSKVGKRANIMRANVMYLTSVLVMLGLIGTFWGMLDTLNSVGEVMSSLATSIDETDGLSSLISGISKPLQGMGIAFSSSLFGLVGSLVGGILNNFCSKGMNRFIEDFGYWIDNHIPVSIDNKGISASDKLQKDRQIQEKNNPQDATPNITQNSQGNQSKEEISNQKSIQHELSRSAKLQEQFLEKMVEYTSTQFYAANSMKQALDSLNSTQTKSLQILHDQQNISIQSAKEVQILRSLILNIASHFPDIDIDANFSEVNDLNQVSGLNVLKQKIDLMEREHSLMQGNQKDVS